MNRKRKAVEAKAIVFQFFDMFFKKFKALLLALPKITDNYSM
jgi:hypothetical protein